MGKQLMRNGQSGSPALGDSFAQFHRVPVDDDRRQQVQPCDAVMLAFPGPIADFTVAIETEGAFDGAKLSGATQPRQLHFQEGWRAIAPDWSFIEIRIGSCTAASFILLPAQLHGVYV